MKISMRWMYGGAAVVVVGLGVFSLRETTSTSRTTLSQTGVAAVAGSRSGSSDSASRPERPGAPLSDQMRAHLRQALKSGDPLVWEPAIRELASLKYNREQGIRELIGLLDHGNWDVKVRASQLLLELGSAVGRGILNGALVAAARGEDVPWAAIVTAATTLQQYRQPIDGDALWAAYQRRKAPELLEIATMQQLPQVRELVEQMRRNRELGYDTEYLAAYLGMKDSESIVSFQRLLTAYPKAELLGHWGLFRATSEPQHLEYVIATARQALGMDPLAGRSAPTSDVKHLAFDFLEVTLDTRATQALRDIADYTAHRSNGGSMDFGRAFGALFYLHKDYSFVDERVLAFLNRSYTGPGVDRGLMMQIAATRRTPEMEAAAKVFNPAAYEYAFVQLHERPVESWWPNLRRVPVSVAPPVK